MTCYIPCVKNYDITMLYYIFSPMYYAMLHIFTKPLLRWAQYVI